jgi:hypothetical protein
MSIDELFIDTDPEGAGDVDHVRRDLRGSIGRDPSFLGTAMPSNELRPKNF